MKVLVTGGAGFIGSHICDKLIELNYQVVCVDNLSNGSMDNIKHLLSNSNFKFYELDINELSSAFFKDIDVVCHQAAVGSVPRSIAQPELYQKSNVNGFFNILDKCKERGIKVIYASSSSVYGDDTTLPKIESSTGKALSPYAATKQINELQAGVFSSVYNMTTIGLRYFNVFGPRQNPNGDYAAVIPKFINLICNNEAPVINGDGSYSRDFTYIDNVVAANILAIESDIETNVFNIGAGGNTSINLLFDEIKKLLNSELNAAYGPFRKGDIPHSFANIEKAKSLLNYNPSVDILQGLEKTVNYFKNI
jgi:UDP-N-acetylglucosamine 4-epimerase